MAKRTCSIPDCTGAVKALGWCNKHYLRMRLTGRTDLSPWQERFWALVDKNGPIPTALPELGRCWQWTAGTVKGGYGRFAAADRSIRSKMAHRISYELLVGDVPNGLELDHLCRNAGCVRPGHLEPVTQIVNILRSNGVSAINARKTHCVNGHAFTPENTYTPPKRPGRRYCRECNRIRSAAHEMTRRAS